MSAHTTVEASASEGFVCPGCERVAPAFPTVVLVGEDWMRRSCSGTGVLGYMVLTLQRDATWADDWDGRLHPTREEGDAALAECREAGWESLLAEARMVVAPEGKGFV